MRRGSRLLLQSALHQYYSGKTDDSSLEKSYRCEVSCLHPQLARCFVQLNPDQETREFLERSKKKSSNVCLQLLLSILYFLLRLFFSQTSINGLLEKGQMFVFSANQLKLLLSSSSSLLPEPPPTPHQPPPPPTVIPRRALDIGSGDGHVTDKVKSVLGAASTVNVTETCRVMQRILRQRGYKVVNENGWYQEQNYDVISCLNVLDRCDEPLSMLRQITEALLPGGILIIALVLPYEPFVEHHFTQSSPSQQLPIDRNASWEVGVSSFWERVLAPLGYTPLAVSKVPYLCEGDLNVEYYMLVDAILVLKKG